MNNDIDRKYTKVAIITGGGRGIGRAITHRLACRGWRCLIVGLDENDLNATTVIDRDYGSFISTCECDIATDEGRNSVVQAWSTLYDRLDLLVNCAAVTISMPLFAQDSTGWRKELETNVIAMALLSSWAIEVMRDFHDGSIVNIGSIYGSLAMNQDFYQGKYSGEGPDGPTRISAYHASKGAVASLTRDLAATAGRWNVRVNTVSPGMIRTPERTFAGDRVRKFGNATPLGRMGSVDEVAAVVEFLASDSASFVTGAEWIVDGGWSIW